MLSYSTKPIFLYWFVCLDFMLTFTLHARMCFGTISYCYQFVKAFSTAASTCFASALLCAPQRILIPMTIIAGGLFAMLPRFIYLVPVYKLFLACCIIKTGSIPKTGTILDHQVEPDMVLYDSTSTAHSWTTSHTQLVAKPPFSMRCSMFLLWAPMVSVKHFLILE